MFSMFARTVFVSRTHVSRCRPPSPSPSQRVSPRASTCRRDEPLRWRTGARTRFRGPGDHQGVPHGRSRVQALDGVDLDLLGRVRRPARAVGQRQVDAAQHPRRTRRADGGDVRYRGHDLAAADDPALTRIAASTSASSSSSTTHSQPDRARERRAGHRDRRAIRCRPRRRWRWSGWAIGSTIFRRSCPAASSSAWRSRAPSPSGPRCCCATSRPARSTRDRHLVLEALTDVNRELGTTTAIITHNAVIAGDGRPRVSPTGGQIAEIRRNERRAGADEFSW